MIMSTGIACGVGAKTLGLESRKHLLLAVVFVLGTRDRSISGGCGRNLDRCTRGGPWGSPLTTLAIGLGGGVCAGTMAAGV